MSNLNLQYPIFGAEILCPHCQQTISAITLTDSYLCQRHGAFEVEPNTNDLVHLSSNRRWRQWDGQWYRQHTHPDGIRFEIHEALDRLHSQGYQATKVIIAGRYQQIITAYLRRGGNSWHSETLKLYGLPVEFSSDASKDPCWDVINFNLEKDQQQQQRSSKRQGYFHDFE